MSDFEIQGLTGLIRDLDEATVRALPALSAVTEANSVTLRETWRENARATVGKHGKWYPSAITSETVLQFGAAAAEIGPDNARRQGRMGRGFEYGSVNQPPHLDGQKAAEVVEPQFLAQIELAAQGLL